MSSKQTFIATDRIPVGRFAANKPEIDGRRPWPWSRQADQATPVEVEVLPPERGHPPPGRPAPRPVEQDEIPLGVFRGEGR